MEMLIILVAVTSVAVPVLAELAAHVFAAGEPTRRRNAVFCS
jgi:hypothetical protein